MIIAITGDFRQMQVKLIVKFNAGEKQWTLERSPKCRCHPLNAGEFTSLYSELFTNISGDLTKIYQLNKISEKNVAN